MWGLPHAPEIFRMMPPRREMTPDGGRPPSGGHALRRGHRVALRSHPCVALSSTRSTRRCTGCRWRCRYRAGSRCRRWSAVTDPACAAISRRTTVSAWAPPGGGYCRQLPRSRGTGAGWRRSRAPQASPQAALGGAQDRSQPSEFLLLPAVLLAQTRHLPARSPPQAPAQARPARRP